MFEIVDSQAAGPVIKVIGVGGAGGNAINHMIEQGVEGVEFIAINTDAQVLSRNRSRNQIQLGSSGLGSGAKPEEARAVALAERISELSSKLRANVVSSSGVPQQKAQALPAADLAKARGMFGLDKRTSDNSKSE